MAKRILACILTVAILSVSMFGAFAFAEDFDPHANGQADQGERDPHDEGGPDQGGPDQGGPKGDEAPASGFVTLVSDNGQVFWEMAVEDASKLYADSGFSAENSQVVRLVPDNEEAYPYLYPDRAWKILFGTVKEEAERPDWFTGDMEAAAFEALDDWKNIVYSAFDYEAFRSLTAEDTISKAPASAEEVTQEALAVFRKYVTLEDSLCTFIKTSVNDSISNAFGASVASDIWNAINHGAGEEAKHASNVGSLLRDMGLSNVGSRQNDFYGAVAGYFVSLDSWLYYDGDSEGYPYDCAWYLWDHGLVISQDSDRLWRLHSAKDGTVFASIPDEEVTVNKAFSALLASDGNVYWKKGRDNEEALKDTYPQLADQKTVSLWVRPILDQAVATIALPDGNNPDVTKYFPYLDEASVWTITYPEGKPEWVTEEMESAVSEAFEGWKDAVYGPFDLADASQIFTEKTRELAAAADEDIALLREWAVAWHEMKDKNLNPTAMMMKNGFQVVGSSFWDEVDSYLLSTWRVQHSDCPGAVVCSGYFGAKGITEKADYDSAVNDTVADSVSDAMEALTGSCFADVDEWAVYPGGYPYAAAATLIRRNLVPCTDGDNWYLTSGQDANVVYQISEAELLAAQ